MKQFVSFIGVLLLAPAASAQPLVWGGDQDGGAPYIFPATDDPHRLVGFEVETMDLLCAKIGRTANFKQGEWTQLPSMLRRKDVDCIANGYEYREEHLGTMIATIPYCVYRLCLVVHADQGSLTRCEDLAKPIHGRRARIGVLSNSAAQAFMEHEFRDSVEIVKYEGVNEAFREVETGKLDGTVQDDVSVIYSLKQFPKLRIVGKPFAKGYYVIYLRPGDEALRDQLNDALRGAIRSGELKKIYERYGVWNEAQDELIQEPTIQRGEVGKKSGWRIVRENLPLLMESAGMTIFLAFASMPIAIVIGLGIALMRLYGAWPFRVIATVYVEVLRGTPLLLQLFCIYFILPEIGINIPALYSAILGLAINYSAYEAEIHRAGLKAVPVTQLEAALALGVSHWSALRRVILPQAMRIVVPPVTNDFIALFKDTSICSVITVMELSKQYSILSHNNTGAILHLAAATAVLYLLMSWPLSLLARRLETGGKK